MKNLSLAMAFASLALTACTQGELTQTRACPVSRPVSFSHTGTVSRNTLENPLFATFAWPGFIVSDSTFHRLLFWDVVPTSETSLPDRVFGQADFDHAAVASDTLISPHSVVWDGSHFIVAESGLNRVLIWNRVPRSYSETPDVVLGQTDPSVRETTPRAPAADSLNLPAAIASDGKHLFVADYSNYRVLGWSSFPTRHGQPADLVLGQDTFTDNTVQVIPTPRFVGVPTGVATDGTHLAISTHTTNRVLIWNTLPSPSIKNPPADVVFGSVDFTTSVHPGAVGDPRITFGTRGIALAAGKLIVADANFNRVMVLNEIPKSNYAAADRVIGRSSFKTGFVDPSDPSPTFPTDPDAYGLSLRVPSAISSDGSCLIINDTGRVTIMPLE